MKKILMIVGSLRKGSFNKQLAEHIVNLMGDRAEVSFLEYSDMPFMNQDIEFPTPEPIARVREKIVAADGLWFVVPEHNNNMPAVVKNLIDWLSRPFEENNPQAGKASADKKVTISGIGGANKTAGSRTNLSNLCSFVGMEVIDKNGCGISYDENTFKTGKIEVSEEDNVMLAEQVERFLSSL